MQRTSGYAALASPRIGSVEKVDGFLAQRFRDFFQGAALLAAQKQDAGAVADDGFRMVFIDCL